MDTGGLLFTFGLVLAGVGIYVLFRWGMDEYGCEETKYFGNIPCYWFYLGLAVLISFLAVWLYAKIMQRGQSSSSLIVTYYIAIVVAIVVISWLLFSHQPTTMQWIGIGFVIIGLILYAYFEAEYIENNNSNNSNNSSKIESF